MKALRACLLSTALAACLLPLASFAAGHHQSGIVGQTSYGFLCDSYGRCTPNLVPMNVRIVSDRGRFIADITSDADGFFEIPLKPG